MNFSAFSKRVREIACDEKSSMRIQYKDDEGTYVTMSTDDDYKDALRCITPIKNHDNIYRLSIKVDDSLTPHPPSKKKQCTTSTTRLNTPRRRKLDFPVVSNLSTSVESVVEAKVAETPLQRFTSSLQLKIDEKLEAKQKLADQEKDLRTRIEDAKLLIAGAGPVCHNCHMRLRHTSRNCTFERCETIYSCGQEKLHPAEFAELRQIRQSINKLEKEIQQLSSDMENRAAAVSKVKNSVTKRIESELLEEDDESYTDNGFRNWQLLRKHVYAIQEYSKKYLNGKIPPKHQLKNVLSLALDENAKLTNKTLLQAKSRRRHRENTFREELEGKGIIFPSEPDSLCDEISDESDPPRYMPMTREEEEEQLNMALSISVKSKPDMASSPTGIQSQGRQQLATHGTIDIQARQYPEQVLQPQTASWFYPTAPSYTSNIFPYFNQEQVRQPEFYYQPQFYYPQNNSSQCSRERDTSSCTITSPVQATQYSHQDNAVQMNISTRPNDEAQLNLNPTNYAVDSLLRLSSQNQDEGNDA